MSREPIPTVHKRVTLTAIAGIGIAALAAPMVIAASTSSAISPTGRAVYVSNSGADSVVVIDPATNATVANIAVGSNPRNLAANPNRSTVYVPDRDGNTVSVIDTTSNTVTTTISDGSFDEPYAISFNASGSLAYVANKAGDSVTVINTASATVAGTIADSGNCIDSPEGIAINPVKPEGYIVGKDGDNVCTFSTSTNAVTTDVAVGNDPRYAVVSLDGAYVYVSNNGGSVSKINTATNAVTDIPSSGDPRNMGLSPDGKKLYVGTMNADIEVIDLATDAVTVIPITGASVTYGVTAPAGTNYAYVSDDSAGFVAVIDTTTNTEVTGTGLPITQADPTDPDIGFNDPKGIVSIGYVPPTPPSDKLTQTAANGCVVVPTTKKIQRAGTWKIMKKNCVTNAGQSVKVSKTCRSNIRGDLRLCKIVRKNGATYLRTYGYRINATVTWKAPATSEYNAFMKVKKYKA